MIFHDRADAGRQLASRLAEFAGDPSLMVLGIPRGGVVVADEVARVLTAPLDFFLATKLPVPEQEELAFGAMAESGEYFLDQRIIHAGHVSAQQIEAIREVAAQRLRQRAALFRAGRAPRTVEDNTVILVDDGIATGASIHVSILALRALRPGRLIVAVPVAPALTCALLRPLVDQLVCVDEPQVFEAVSQFYLYFPQSTDAQVAELLRRAEETAP
ncbi:MAG TPA: phosphoribosyltransferase family protein [Terracidiphilus sp.]|jgi:putative phosphoribosyl transferase|nr:phosphoribosyltransferase family protein [Terracidiphilus sp.]